jgi:hypothetical protein
VTWWATARREFVTVVIVSRLAFVRAIGVNEAARRVRYVPGPIRHEATLPSGLRLRRISVAGP